MNLNSTFETQVSRANTQIEVSLIKSFGEKAFKYRALLSGME